jgi:hypothetical protein
LGKTIASLSTFEKCFIIKKLTKREIRKRKKCYGPKMNQNGVSGLN